jgi:hypothetical protein
VSLYINDLLDLEAWRWKASSVDSITGNLLSPYLLNKSKTTKTIMPPSPEL